MVFMEPEHAAVPASDRLRVLTVVTRLDLGGAQQVALAQVRALPLNHYEPHVIAGAGGLLDAEVRNWPGVRTELWPGFKHPIHPAQDSLTLWGLVRYMRQWRIQLVHTHSSKAGILGRWAAALAGVPAVLHTVHGWPFHEYQALPVRNLYRMLEQRAARWTTRIIAVSAATRDKGLAQRIGRPEQYEIIYPGTPVEDFRPADASRRRDVRAEFGWPEGTPLVGMVACLKPQKAPEDFVRAAAVVRRALPDARFLLVGDGPRRGAVEREIRRLDLEGHVHLTGWRRDVSRLLPALDVMALSSKWEGLPCVLAQAMSSGVPVAATAVEGTPEALGQGEAGLLVPPGSPDRLGDSLVRLLTDHALRQRLSAAGRTRAPQFGQTAMLSALNCLYARVADSLREGGPR